MVSYWRDLRVYAVLISLVFLPEVFGSNYTNPVLPCHCPDPGVLRLAVNSTISYVVATTSGDDANAFPLHVSNDLVHFSPQGFIFPEGQLPSWASTDFWAPEIHVVPHPSKKSFSFVAFFTAREATSKHLCVGAAHSADPLGPWVDIGAPLIHLPSSLDAIDASFIWDETTDQCYLMYKEMWLPKKPYSRILVVRVSCADGVTLMGETVTAIGADLEWEAGDVEGPWMIYTPEVDRQWFLFYSGNDFGSANYAVGVARSEKGPMGPWTKRGDPIITTAPASREEKEQLKDDREEWATPIHWLGPGHCSVVRGLANTTVTDWYMVYHAWPGKLRTFRETLVDRIVFKDGWPYVGHPSNTPQPLPH